MKTFVNS